jgi:uncharacterized membrane protein
MLFIALQIFFPFNCLVFNNKLFLKVNDSVKQKGSLHFTRSIAVVLIIGTVAATVLTLISGGPSSLMAAISKSGFTAAFTLIFVSEIGDKVSAFLLNFVQLSYLFVKL